MNYGKLQLSFILLFIMTVIQLLTSLFIVKKSWLTLTSLIAMGLCIGGIFYILQAESKHKH
ncbi:MAG: hypothetical protein H9872_04960 [Candidatus Cellulosilyticum pullistercoris]|uniref:Uncharacterized protein n=1 Tax=Candidatus Cellulosilyticum pullistercoris TaxID=2838521 RepID=A0A9E2NL03_9FIRM|nr:hypothetical protein [Candidatus Cellulosilyticum pullistercoris]